MHGIWVVESNKPDGQILVRCDSVNGDHGDQRSARPLNRLNTVQPRALPGSSDLPFPLQLVSRRSLSAKTTNFGRAAPSLLRVVVVIRALVSGAIVSVFPDRAQD
jgi:hypothetical protein